MHIFIINFVLVFICAIWLIWYNSPTQKGKRGEREIDTLLKTLPAEYVSLSDIMLKTYNGTTQIDHVVVSPYGVFVIETKNYYGEICGDDDRQEWTKMVITPVTYNRKHLDIHSEICICEKKSVILQAKFRTLNNN